MIDVQTMSLQEVGKTGLAVLARVLVPVELSRFLQIFEPGCGDYTAERHERLDDQSLDEILGRIEKRCEDE